jgi:glutaredoxin-related protein
MNKKEIENKIEELKGELQCIKGEDTEVYARIVGYYRPVNNWNKGKKDEFFQRLHFECDENKKEETSEVIKLSDQSNTETEKDSLEITVNEKGKIKHYKMFYSEHCPGCKPVKSILQNYKLKGTEINASTKEGLEEALKNNITGTPTVLFYDEADNLVSRAHNATQLEKLF